MKSSRKTKKLDQHHVVGCFGGPVLIFQRARFQAKTCAAAALFRYNYVKQALGNNPGIKSKQAKTSDRVLCLNNSLKNKLFMAFDNHLGEREFQGPRAAPNQVAKRSRRGRLARRRIMRCSHVTTKQDLGREREDKKPLHHRPRKDCTGARGTNGIYM